MWTVIQICTPLFILFAGYWFGMPRAKPQQQTYLSKKLQESMLGISSVQGETVESQIYRFREQYARGEMELPAFEKTVEQVLQSGGMYGRQAWR